MVIDAVKARIDQIHIISQASNKGIRLQVARTTNKRIPSIARNERVAPPAAIHRVVARVAPDRIIKLVSRNRRICSTGEGKVFYSGNESGGEREGDRREDEINSGNVAYFFRISIYDVGVISSSSKELIDSRPAIETVVSSAGIDGIRPGISNDRVREGISRGEEVRFACEGDHFDKTSVFDRGRAFRNDPIKGVRIGSLLDDHVVFVIDKVCVPAGAADHGIGSKAPDEIVRSRAAEQGVVTAAAEERVVTLAADQRIRRAEVVNDFALSNFEDVNAVFSGIEADTGLVSSDFQ